MELDATGETRYLIRNIYSQPQFFVVAKINLTISWKVWHVKEEH